MQARSRAQEKAQALRQQLQLGDGYVDVFDVLRRIGIEVYRAPVEGDGLEGSLIIAAGSAFMFVNSTGALTRQRLTAAHELGHYELGGRHDGTEIVEDYAGVVDEHEEWDAFRFARHFLMDEAGVRQLTSSIEDEEARVAAVAHAFVVSPSVAAIHLQELNVIRRATKDRLKQAFDAGVLKPSAFLLRHGYAMEDLSSPVRSLDPGHVARSFEAYAHGELGLVALSELLQEDEERTLAIIAEAGLAVPDEPDEDPAP